MSKNWDRVAENQFKGLPDDIQNAWGDLREEVNRQ